MAAALAVSAGFAKEEERGHEDTTTTTTLGVDGHCTSSPTALGGEDSPAWHSHPRRRPFLPTASAAAAAAVLLLPKKHPRKKTAPPPPEPEPDPSRPSSSSSSSIPHETKLQLLQESEEKRGPQLAQIERERERNSRRKQTELADERANGRTDERGGTYAEDPAAAEGSLEEENSAAAVAGKKPNSEGREVVACMVRPPLKKIGRTCQKGAKNK